MHKFHHHFEVPWTDRNYGNMLSIWDRIFGTFTYGPPTSNTASTWRTTAAATTSLTKWACRFAGTSSPMLDILSQSTYLVTKPLATKANALSLSTNQFF